MVQVMAAALITICMETYDNTGIAKLLHFETNVTYSRMLFSVSRVKRSGREGWGGGGKDVAPASKSA